MSDAATFGGRARVRALSFAMSALIAAATCLLLIALSRVTAYIENLTSAGVEAELAPLESGRRQAPPPLRTTDAAAAPTLTPLPVDRELLARTLDCYDTLRVDDRPAECPRFSDEHMAAARQGLLDPRLPRSPMQAFTRAEQAALFAGTDPPCVPGFSNSRLAVSYCARFGVRPPPPSRSAEEICLTEGIGPCTPPPFRAEDVVHLRRTQWSAPALSSCIETAEPPSTPGACARTLHVR
jgi:hypothetical protein